LPDSKSGGDSSEPAISLLFFIHWDQCPIKDGSDGTGAIPAGWPVPGVMVPGPLRPGRPPTGGSFVGGIVPPGVVGPAVPAPGVMTPGLKELLPREPPEMIWTWPRAKADNTSAPLVAMIRSDFLDMAFISVPLADLPPLQPVQEIRPHVSEFSGPQTARIRASTDCLVPTVWKMRLCTGAEAPQQPAADCRRQRKPSPIRHEPSNFISSR